MENLLKNRRILVVDDFNEMRTMIKQMLIQLDVGEIDMVENGKEAIAQLQNNAYDIILCDYNLGEGTNGQQVLDEAQKESLINYATIYIIITAEVSKEIVLSAVASQPDDYLAKPFNKDLLRKRLERILVHKKNLTSISKWASRKNYINAIKACNSEIAKAPKNINQIKRIKAELFEKIGDLSAADTIYTDILAQNKSPWALFSHGTILYRQNQSDSAKSVFLKLIEISPTYTAAYDAIATLEEDRHNFKSAKSWLGKAIAIAPNVLQRQKRLGLISYALGDLHEAGTALTKVVKMARDSIYETGENEANLAKVYLKLGDSVKALKLINSVKRTYQTRPESKIHLALAVNMVHMNRGSSGLANEALQEASETYNTMHAPPSLDITVKLASALIESGNTDAGALMLTNMARDNHNKQDILDALQKVFDDHGIGKDGRSSIAAATKRVVEINNKGIGLAKDGQLEEANRLFKSVIASMPHNIFLHLQSIQILLMMLKRGRLSPEDQHALEHSIATVGKCEPHNLTFNRLMNHYNKSKS